MISLNIKEHSYYHNFVIYFLISLFLIFPLNKILPQIFPTHLHLFTHSLIIQYQAPTMCQVLLYLTLGMQPSSW